MKNLRSKENLKEIRVDIQAALDLIAKKHNIENFKLGNMSYDESGFRLPVEAVFEGGESKDLKSLRLNAPFLGFKPEIANAEIMYGKKKYKVVGLSRTKLKLLGLDDEKNYTAATEMVLNALKLQKSELVA